MDYIVAIFHPFEIKQEIMVYQHGECINKIHPCLEDVVKTICSLNQQYHADRIELCGVPSFVSKYVKELKSNFFNMPIIEIIPR